MNKSAEFEISFTPVLKVDIKQFKKNVGGGRIRYFLGANVFTIFPNGTLVISCPTNIVHLNSDSWISNVRVLSENNSSANVFISITDEKKNVEFCYECELPTF